MSRAYYNEFDKFSAAWLRELIKYGCIAPGDVDERDIQDVLPRDLDGYTQCHLFAGIGVWSYSLRCAGWKDDRPIWTCSCPCQPFSAAGEGLAFDDERHLWPAAHHLIKERRPVAVLGEQVASKDAEYWLDLVQTDLEALGYAFGAVPFPAASVGAPNLRDRLYWVADSGNKGSQGLRKFEFQPLPERFETEERHITKGNMASPFWDGEAKCGADGVVRIVPQIYGQMVNGTSGRVGALRGYGNAINAVQAQTFIEAFMEYSA